ncbi:neprilysin-1 [Drosophila mojavensis]|uniref:neprilysin-1 n=1 Tax=Drosophila mojavensis TaxID=7230 RepID=UPI00017CA69E|nr:neprilysin-1 [Drosophila mojavensis]
MFNVRELCKLQLWLPLGLSLCLSQCLWRPILASHARLPVYIQRHMNASADACVDFYEHACGGWSLAHADDVYASQLEQLDYEYHASLAELLEQQPGPQEPRFVQLLRDSYVACRRLDKRYDAAQFVRWLAEWSRGETESETESASASERGNGSALIHLLKTYGLGELLQYENEEEEEEAEAEALSDAEQRLLQLQLPWPNPEDYLSDAGDYEMLTHASFRQLYRELQPLGVAERRLWKQLHRLEQQLCRCAQQQEQEQEQMRPLMLWLLPLPAASARPSATRRPAYLSCVSALLAEQPVSLLAAYLQLRLLRLLQQLPAPAFGRQQCAAQSRQLLTHAAVWLLQQQVPHAQRHHTNDTMHQLFEQLRQQFKLQLQVNRNRFDNATQSFLLQKLQRMRLRVGVLPSGSPEQQQQQLEEHYAQLQLRANDYYGNLLALLRQTQRWAAGAEGEAADGLFVVQSDGFGSYASCFFLFSRNLVVLPHSLLAANLYRSHQPKVFTHSGLGFLLAHELSHGFDLSGVVYDGRGKLASRQQRQRLSSNARFANQKTCLKRRHAEIADEKFADLNGLSLAYDSYFTAHCQHKEATGARCGTAVQQHFFLNFAQFFCRDDLQPEDTSEHGSSRQRVNDAVASSQHFARAFGCERSRHKHPLCQLY